MISSLAYEDTFERAKAIGARGFVDKPFHQEQLLKVFGEARKLYVNCWRHTEI